MIENYLDILESSLKEKLQIMDQIQKCNMAQKELFGMQPVNLEMFDSYVNEKDRLIDELLKLDSGFETLYGKVAAELEENKQQYAAQIQRLQKLVTEVTDSSVTIQAQEARNKQLVEQYFSELKNGISRQRVNSKAAYNYYKSVSRTHNDGNTSHFMDSRQ